MRGTCNESGIFLNLILEPSPKKKNFPPLFLFYDVCYLTKFPESSKFKNQKKNKLLSFTYNLPTLFQPMGKSDCETGMKDFFDQ